ncbi:type II secretion system protein J [uncultured Jatrophihabitans sp.]|uniref:type II secretion system protein J n=1 Tax=uncultured Jatrophihabitans sp. TaxID=1610747 RepID=UPI0035C96993
MLSRLQRQDDTADDAGMTLVELVVGMTLMSIVGAIAMTFFVGMSTQTARVGAQTQDAAAARTALNQISTVLRLADTPTARPGYSTSRFQVPSGQNQLTGSEIVFFANIGNGQTPSRATDTANATAVRIPPTKVDIKLVNGTLTEYTYAPLSLSYGTGYDWTTNYPSTPTTTSVLLSGVANSTVFAYCSDATDIAQTCTSTTAPDSVAVVQVTLTTTPLRGNAAQTVQSSVAITGAVS